MPSSLPTHERKSTRATRAAMPLPVIDLGKIFGPNFVYQRGNEPRHFDNRQDRQQDEAENQAVVSHSRSSEPPKGVESGSIAASNERASSGRRSLPKKKRKRPLKDSHSIVGKQSEAEMSTKKKKKKRERTSTTTSEVQPKKAKSSKKKRKQPSSNEVVAANSKANPKAKSPKTKREATVVGDIASSTLNRCVPTTQVLSNVSVEEGKAATLPEEFSSLVNFPQYCGVRPVGGTKSCVMCGNSRPVLKKRSGAGIEPYMHAKCNGVCSSCEIAVWALVEINTHIKFCTQCNHFRTLAHFVPKDSTSGKKNH